MKNPWQNVKIGPQCQIVTPMGNFVMLWARQNGGEKGRKEKEKKRERRQKKKRKREK